LNQPSAPTAPAPTAAPAESPNGSGVYESDFTARSNSVFGNDDAKPAGDASPAAPTSIPDASSADSAPVDHAQARRERLAKLQAQERASVDAKQRQKGNEELQQRLAVAEKERDEAKRMAEQRIDFASLDERSFLEHAAKARVTPARLAEWIKEQTERPELAVHRAAESAIAPKLSEWDKRFAEKEAKLDAIIAQQEQQAVQREEAEAFNEFAGFVQQNAVTSPFAAAFLRTHGPEQFSKLAFSAAASVPPGAGAQAVLDHIEENLSMLAPIYAAPAATPAKPSTLPNINGAAKPMTTVSNTLAQTRASVVDEDAEWSSLPFEERSARVFGR
jgi:hypothetical protein